MRFAIGDLIIYGETGVCRVEEIVEKEFLGEIRPCYKLQPIYQSCIIFTPADNEAVFMRPILTKNEAEALIESIPSIKPMLYSANSPRELSEVYDKIIKLHDCNELATLIISVYAKRKEYIAKKKKFSAIDERFVKKAEDLLFGELASALGTERTAFRPIIEEKASI